MIESGWIEFLGRRDSDVPAAPPPVHAEHAGPPPLLVNPLPTALSWAHEGTVAACGMAFLALMWLGAQAIRPLAHDTVFAAAQLRDVRLALRLYHREHGQYPRQLEDLVEDRWVERSQLSAGGRALHYRPIPDTDGFTLDLPEER